MNKILKDIKTSKPIKKGDVIVFVIAVVLIVVTLCVFVFFPKKTTATGFKIMISDKSVAVFDYQAKTLSVDEEFTEFIEHDKELFTIKVYTSKDKSAYNTISYSAEKRCVKVIDANCPNHDCMLSQTLYGDKDGAIVCLPHSLRIVNLTYNGNVVVG